jgi:chaperonin GroEL
VVAKRLLYGQAGRARLLAGTRALSNAVKPTLGPGGRTVLLQRPMYSAPLCTKDGVTVAEEIEFDDRFANMGAQLVIESAAKTSFAAGDGTTTATVLAHALFSEGAKLVAAGCHPIELKRGIELAVERVGTALDELSKPAEDVHILAVATISANGDRKIGELVAGAVEKVGKEGVIHVEQGTALESTIEVTEGTEVAFGFSSPYFITDGERLVAELEDPLILLHEKKIGTARELVPILDRVASAGRSLLVVAELENEALSLLTFNKLKGTLKVCAIRPPSYAQRRKDMLKDLSAQIGGHAILDEPGLRLEDVKLEDLGRAKRVVSSQEKTTIVGGTARSDEIEGRVREIRAAYAATNSDFDHQQLEERLRKLVGGAALIRIGGTTDAEVRERKARLEDALYATRAALDEGVVPGGGVALLRASERLSGFEQGLPVDQAAGVLLVRRICAEPCRRIAENAGRDGSVVVERVRASEGNVGYDAVTGQMVDLVERGVIDPTRVVRLALEHAASVATMLIMAETFIIDAPRKVVDYPVHGSSHDAMSMEPFLSRR